MGAARQRGTYEERRETAILRNEARAERERAAEYARQQARREMRDTQPRPRPYLAGLMAATSSSVFVYENPARQR